MRHYLLANVPTPEVKTPACGTSQTGGRSSVIFASREGAL